MTNRGILYCYRSKGKDDIKKAVLASKLVSELNKCGIKSIEIK